MAALICILRGLPKDARVASFIFLKSTSQRYRKSKKTLYGPYCKVLQKYGVWQPDYKICHGTLALQLCSRKQLPLLNVLQHIHMQLVC